MRHSAKTLNRVSFNQYCKAEEGVSESEGECGKNGDSGRLCLRNLKAAMFEITTASVHNEIAAGSCSLENDRLISARLSIADRQVASKEETECTLAALAPFKSNKRRCACKVPKRNNAS